ncbi:MAG: succinate dehydrogenase, cytochrome b556 subunit [Hyphomicrobiaceae bacterium]|nr:succinate dehydrogenase, cytochrome b556 subunit [Hyphomicrobiaceae bacterium]
MSTSTTKSSRPLSPHLQIYKLTWTMVMSIIHRVTGAGLYFGTLLLAWWLVSAAIGPGAFATAKAVFGSFLGRLVLFGFTWALFHHMIGGVRHFIWDLGRGFGEAERFLLAKITLGGSLALTILTWIVAYAAN